MAYLALCLQSYTCSNRCFFGPPWSKRWWVQHLAGDVVTDLREVYLEHLEQNTKCFFFKGCDWRCDSPPWLARLRNTVFFCFTFFLCFCSHQSEEIRRHQRAVDHESFPQLEKARSSCALMESLPGGCFLFSCRLCCCSNGGSGGGRKAKNTTVTIMIWATAIGFYGSISLLLHVFHLRGAEGCWTAMI